MTCRATPIPSHDDANLAVPTQHAEMLRRSLRIPIPSPRAGESRIYDLRSVGKHRRCDLNCCQTKTWRFQPQRSTPTRIQSQVAPPRLYSPPTSRMNLKWVLFLAPPTRTACKQPDLRQHGTRSHCSATTTPPHPRRRIPTVTSTTVVLSPHGPLRMCTHQGTALHVKKHLRRLAVPARSSPRRQDNALTRQRHAV